MKVFRRFVLLLFCILCSEQSHGSMITYEAEDAELHMADVRNNNDGFSGEGYADFGGFGAYVEWTVYAPVTADYQVYFRYSAKVSRPCTLVVDGNSNPIRPIHFHETGAWDEWNVESLTVNLSQGTHTLQALAVTSTGPNIDWMALSSSTHDTLQPNEVLYQEQFLTSPSGQYQFGLTDAGLLVLRSIGNANPIWEADSAGAHVCKMQGDGNLVCRDENSDVRWKSDTSLNDGAILQVTNSGTALIDLNGMEIWSVGTSVQTPTPVQSPTPAPIPPPTASPVATASSGVVLELNEFLLKGQFVYSPSGAFKLGLSADGEFVLENSSGGILWSAGVISSHGPGTADQLFMQDDGNLVVRDANRTPLWDSDTFQNFGAHLLISNEGKAVVELQGVELWAVSSAGQEVTPPPIPASTPSPVTSLPNPTTYEFAIVLEPDERLDLGDFVSSPNGAFQVGLRNDGEFVLESSSGVTLWSAGVVNEHGPNQGVRCNLQADGNLLVRNANGNSLWNSRTSGNEFSGNPGSILVVDDGGQISLLFEGTPIWLQGIPRGTYQAPPASQDLQFPIRGQFYYPWYPHTWTVNDAVARFEPTLGFYSSGDPMIAVEHVDMLDYSFTDLSIASWWGPDTNLDKARLTMLMDTTVEMGSNMKWTIYHEDEFHFDASAAEIRDDLDYLMEWFAWHPAWAHIDGRPVVFVYNEAGCEVAERWMAASNSEWYVVLKLFKDFRGCPVQPDSWHQYGPADAVVQIEDHSFGVSPGFWRADIAEPRLERVSKDDFCNNVAMMVQSGDPWQLVTTFNEAGEGTMIEPSPDWASSSGYGYYLDCLHTYH